MTANSFQRTAIIEKQNYAFHIKKHSYKMKTIQEVSLYPQESIYQLHH